MTKGVVFQSEFNQVPQALTPPDNIASIDLVDVERTGITKQVGESWDDWFDDRELVDFPSDREQPSDQDREPL